eukprot:4496571-Pleurochrysis_carterae.AAC.1
MAMQRCGENRPEATQKWIPLAAVIPVPCVANAWPEPWCMKIRSCMAMACRRFVLEYGLMNSLSRVAGHSPSILCLLLTTGTGRSAMKCTEERQSEHVLLHCSKQGAPR